MNLELVPGPDAQDELFRAMQKQGSLWGARKDVIDRALSAMNEFIEAAAVRKLARDKVDIKVSFDEFNLDVDISYEGDLMCFRIRRLHPKSFWPTKPASPNSPPS